MKNNLDKDHIKVENKLIKGIKTNFLSLLGKIAYPIFLVVNTRLHHPEIMGIFILTLSIIDITTRLTISGFQDGLLMFASRYNDDDRKSEKMYRVIANAFIVSISISLIIIFLSFTGGAYLLKVFFSQKNLPAAVQILALSLPFITVTELVLALTKSKQIMKYNALIIALRPVTLCLISVICYFLGMGLYGILFAYTFNHMIYAIICLFIYHKYYSFKALLEAILHFKFFSPIVSFSIPMNLNMTFNQFITGVDVIMLGMFGIDEKLIAFYGTASLITRNIKEIKKIFTTAYAPVIARYYYQNKIPLLNETFIFVCRWSTIIALPVIFLIALFRQDIMLIFHNSYTMDTTVVLLLLLNPLMANFLGTAGNVVSMAGFSKVNLINSIFVATINIVLNYLLIPKYMFIGAAIASIIAEFSITVLQALEAKILIGVKLNWIKLLPVLFSATILIIPFALIELLFSLQTQHIKIILATSALLSYFIILKKFKIKKTEQPSP